MSTTYQPPRSTKTWLDEAEFSTAFFDPDLRLKTHLVGTVHAQGDPIQCTAQILSKVPGLTRSMIQSTVVQPGAFWVYYALNISEYCWYRFYSTQELPIDSIWRLVGRVNTVDEESATYTVPSGRHSLPVHSHGLCDGVSILTVCVTV